MALPAGYLLTVEREPSIEDRRALSDALGAYNEPFLPDADPHSLAVLVRGPGGDLRAGLDGFTYAGWLCSSAIFGYTPSFGAAASAAG